MIEISCIISAWNRLELLNRCLMSLSRQTNKNFEIILIDDDSDEDMHSLYRKFINELNITYVQLNNRRGHVGWAMPFNLGTRMAKSPLILRLGSEIIVQNDIIQRLVNHLKSDKGEKLAYFGACYDIDTPEKLAQIDSVGWQGNMKLLEGLSIKLFHHATYWVTPYLMGIRKEWLDQIGGADEKIIEGPDDSDLWMRLAAIGVKQVNDLNILGAHQYHPYQVGDTTEGTEYVWRIDGWRPGMPLVYNGTKEDIVRNK